MLAEARRRDCPEGDLELVPEDEILQGQIASRSKPDDEGADEQEEEVEHPAG